MARLLRLARAAVWAEVAERSGGKPPASAANNDSDPTALPAAPVFVTIERAGRVVGCRGTLGSRGRSLNEAVALAARAAAGHDPRYAPLTPAALSAPPGFLITITIVSRLVPLSEAGINTLAPGEGLVLRTNGRTGIVLPWEGRDPRTRLGWAYKKAGAAPGSACTLERMIAERFRG